MDAGGWVPGEGGSIETKRGECFQGGLTLFPSLLVALTLNQSSTTPKISII